MQSLYPGTKWSVNYDTLLIILATFCGLPSVPCTDNLGDPQSAPGSWTRGRQVLPAPLPRALRSSPLTAPPPTEHSLFNCHHACKQDRLYDAACDGVGKPKLEINTTSIFFFFFLLPVSRGAKCSEKRVFIVDSLESSERYPLTLWWQPSKGLSSICLASARNFSSAVAISNRAFSARIEGSESAGGGGGGGGGRDGAAAVSPGGSSSFCLSHSKSPVTAGKRLARMQSSRR